MKNKAKITAGITSHRSRQSNSSRNYSFSPFGHKNVIGTLNNFSPEARRNIFLSPVSLNYVPFNTNSFSKDQSPSPNIYSHKKTRVSPIGVIQKALKKLKMKRKGMDQLFSPLRTLEQTEYQEIQKILSGKISHRKKIRNLMKKSKALPSPQAQNLTLRDQKYPLTNLKMFKTKVAHKKKTREESKSFKSPQPKSPNRFDFTDPDRFKKIGKKMAKLFKKQKHAQSPPIRMNEIDRGKIMSGLLKKNTERYSIIQRKGILKVDEQRKQSVQNKQLNPVRPTISTVTPDKPRVMHKLSSFSRAKEITIGRLETRRYNEIELQNKFSMKKLKMPNQEVPPSESVSDVEDYCLDQEPKYDTFSIGSKKNDSPKENVSSTSLTVIKTRRKKSSFSLNKSKKLANQIIEDDSEYLQKLTNQRHNL
ncbi:unnamed protein product [Moneuplotes crassus]|uniref:Uncharacterized protein n=1 Tax=Euplotes crassus TaxID=5936 RepID=A0AAD1Y7E1_EUPCR|nr:unnamed protein product [Moneuplotes crassus]